MADSFTLVWYAAICGVLSAFSPSLSGLGARVGVGAIVGVAAASLLPVLKSMMGL